MKGTNLPSTLTSMSRNIALLTHFLRQRFFSFFFFLVSEFNFYVIRLPSLVAIADFGQLATFYRIDQPGVTFAESGRGNFSPGDRKGGPQCRGWRYNCKIFIEYLKNENGMLFLLTILCDRSGEWRNPA